MYFKWIQLLHAIANHWEKELTENTINSQNLSYLNHHRIKSYHIYYIEKLTMKELYLISPQHETTTPISQKCFESMFRDLTLQWKHIYTLPRITTIDSKLWCFQYIILHNTLYLNEKLFLFHKHNTALCSFCNLEDETVIHLFVYCSKTKQLSCTVIQYFLASLKLMIKYFKHKIIFYYYSNIMFMSQEVQMFFLLKLSWELLWKCISWKETKAKKVMKGKENYLQKKENNSTKFVKF